MDSSHKPIFFTDDGREIPLRGHFKGRSCFLIAGGPSLATVDLKPLKQAGILTCTMNNSIKLFRSNLWVSVDDPPNFIRSAWLDPTVMKFIRECHTRLDAKNPHSKKVFNSDKWQFMDELVMDCPSIVYWRHNSHFQADKFLIEDSICWGDEDRKSAKAHGMDVADRGYGGRSVMLATMRILHEIGVKTVYLLGADFKMLPEVGYAFGQGRSAGSVKNNNDTYRQLIGRFSKLRPIFEKAGFNVFNCNPTSELKVFDYVPMDTAIERTLLEFGRGEIIDIAKERTEGLYDRKDREEKERQENTISEIMIDPKTAIARKLVDQIDDWKACDISALRIGDRIKLWNRVNGEKTRFKTSDNSKEWTIASVREKTNIIHWSRATHIRHDVQGTLLAAIAKAIGNTQPTKPVEKSEQAAADEIETESTPDEVNMETKGIPQSIEPDPESAIDERHFRQPVGVAQ